MLKKYPIIKWSIISFVLLITSIVTFGIWFMSLLPSEGNQTKLREIHPENLPYLSKTIPKRDSKILIVVTSCGVMGNSEKKTGYELTEVSRPYYVFKANGLEVDIASPKGGKPPVIIDWEDMGAFDYAFLNDHTAQYKTTHTIPIQEVVAKDYDAIFFAGGKGAMFDFPQDTNIQSIVREHYESGKVIGAVCHGPAALVNVTLNDGNPLLVNKNVSGFTNEEELFLIPDAKEIFPFLLEDALIAKGATFNKGDQYLKMVSQDGNLITGQNPWSTWASAEAVVTKMGYVPVERTHTAEENAIDILSVYSAQGYKKAKAKLNKLITIKGQPIDRPLLAMHGIVAAMKWELSKAFDLVNLTAHAKGLSSR